MPPKLSFASSLISRMKYHVKQLANFSSQGHHFKLTTTAARKAFYTEQMPKFDQEINSNYWRYLCNSDEQPADSYLDRGDATEPRQCLLTTEAGLLPPVITALVVAEGVQIPDEVLQKGSKVLLSKKRYIADPVCVKKHENNGGNKSRFGYNKLAAANVIAVHIKKSKKKYHRLVTIIEEAEGAENDDEVAAEGENDDEVAAEGENDDEVDVDEVAGEGDGEDDENDGKGVAKRVAKGVATVVRYFGPDEEEEYNTFMERLKSRHYVNIHEYVTAYEAL